MTKKLISIITPCYNEEKNIPLIYDRIKQIFQALDCYDYEHIFIDNHSIDETVTILKEIAERDKRIKIIVNSRNFGFICSSFYGLIQGNGDAVAMIFSDLQDPPELLLEFIDEWEKGYEIIKGIKSSSQENFCVYTIRRFYYWLAKQLSENVELTSNFTGFGLYDQKVIENLRRIDDPYPYLKGLISEVGFKIKTIKYEQKIRQHGKSSFNFYRMYDLAMVGITTYSNLPLRIATMLGLALSIVSLLIGFSTLITKIIFWNYFPVGIAAIIISLSFFSSVQLFFIGILGEYIGLINRRTLRRPLIIERERINF